MELFFLDIFNSTLSALGAATFPNSIPVQCIKNFLDSTIINEEIKYPSLNQFLEPCCCCIGKTFQCWHISSPVLFSTRVTSFTMPPTHLTKHLILYDDIWFCCGLNTSTPPCKGAMEGFLLVVLSVFISSDRYMRRWYKLVKSFYVLQWKSKQDIRVKYVIYFCCEIFLSS